MKLKVLMIMLVVAALSLFAGVLYAANGDLIVDGNLGVGTDTPQNRADINGNMRVSGNLVTTGSTTLGGQLSVGAAGIMFSDGSVQTTAGGPTTQNAFTSPTRAIGTVYQNTTGKPMWVVVSASVGSEATFSAKTDSANPPTTVVDEDSKPGTYKAHVGFWVLPNNYYKVQFNAGTPTLSRWTEWY